MNKTFLKATLSFLFAIAISCSMFANRALALGDFSQTCYDSSLSGSILTSTCEKADGYTLNTSSIDLNSYIENINGSLKWQPDNYIETCRGMDLISDSQMAGECKTRSGSWSYTQIHLDDHITNRNGTLEFE